VQSVPQDDDDDRAAQVQQQAAKHAEAEREPQAFTHLGLINAVLHVIAA